MHLDSRDHRELCSYLREELQGMDPESLEKAISHHVKEFYELTLKAQVINAEKFIKHWEKRGDMLMKIYAVTSVAEYQEMDHQLTAIAFLTNLMDGLR